MNTFFIDRRSPEFHFINCALKASISENECCEIRNIYEDVRNEFNWKRLIEEADALEVIPFIYKAVLHSGIKENVPTELFLRIENEYFTNLARNLKILKESGGIAFLFKNEGIETLFLGGVSLLGSIYSDYGLRYIGDIDILINDRDRRKAYEVLREIGYSSFGNYDGFFTGQKNFIDIKTDLLSTDRIFSRKLIFPIDDNFCYENNRPHPLIENASVLPPSRELISCALHIFKHSFSRIMWSIDIAGIIRLCGSELFYSEVITLLESNKASLPLYYSLKYVRDCRLAQIDNELLGVLKEGFRERWFGRKIYAMLAEGKGTAQFSEILTLQSKESLYSRLKLLLESMFPRKKIMKEIYPKCPEFLIFTAYVARFFSMVFLFASMSAKVVKNSAGR